MHPSPFAKPHSGGGGLLPAGQRSSSAASDVFVAVRDGILGGTFQPGEQLTESQIASMLGVSRTPVREALHELELQGLLTRRHRRILVANVSADEAANVHEIRVALETVAVRQAMTQGAESLFSDLERSISDLRYEIRNKDTAMALSAARGFHEIIFTAADNEMLIRFLSQVYNRVDQHRFYSSGQRSSARLKNTLDEHTAIVRAMQAGDIALAVEQMVEHLKSSYAFDIMPHTPDRT
jgi:DNA-binding GntR family transcriptional regulator